MKATVETPNGRPGIINARSKLEGAIRYSLVYIDYLYSQCCLKTLRRCDNSDTLYCTCYHSGQDASRR
jgi:hypothetical protein